MVRNAGVVQGVEDRDVRGFSLIEIVVALGIISVAIVGIMGLFPVAMRSAQESQRETRAATIAQQIFSDLESAPGTNRFILIGQNGQKTNVNIAVSSTNAPHVIYFSDTAVSQATAATDSLFLANLYITPDSPVPGMSRVEALVQAPLAAAGTNRAQYSFITLLNYH